MEATFSVRITKPQSYRYHGGLAKGTVTIGRRVGNSLQVQHPAYSNVWLVISEKKVAVIA